MTDTTSQSQFENRKNTKLNLRKIIPPYLSAFKMIATTAEFRVSYDAPTDQSTYTYTLTWEDASEIEQDQKQKRSVSASEPTKTRSSTSTKLSEKESTHGKTVNRVSENSIEPVIAVCDGPCKKSVTSNKLNTLGRCGHYLCEACYGIVINSDGTKGCSSFACNWKGNTKTEAMKSYEMEIVQKQRKRAKEMKHRGVDVKIASSFDNESFLSTKSSSTMLSTTNKTEPTEPTETEYTDFQSATPCETSQTSSIQSEDSTKFIKKYPNKNEMVIVKFVLIEKTPFDATLRVYNTIESATSICAAEIIDQFLSNANKDYDFLKRGKLYFVDCGNDGTQIMKRLKNSELPSKRLIDFPLIRENILFILDTINYLKKEDVKISLTSLER